MEFENEIDVKKLLLKYSSSWHIILPCIVFFLGAAFLINKLSEPVYQAKSTLLISQNDKPSLLMQESARPMRSEGWRNEIAILQSQTLVDRTIQNMNVDISYYEIERFLGLSFRREIYEETPFIVQWDKNHIQPFGENIRVSILSEFSYVVKGLNESINSENNSIFHFGEEVKGPGYSFLLNIPQNFHEGEQTGKEYEFVIHNDRKLSAQYFNSFNAETRGRDYSIVDITFRATNQQRALDFVSNLSEMYIRQNLEEKNHIAQNTILFVEEQLEGVSGDLSDTELSLQQFRQRHQMMEIGPVATQLAEELKELDKQKSIEQVKKQYYDLLMEYVRDDLEFSQVFGPSALGIDDPLLNSLLMDLSKFHNERARLLLTTTVNSPSVQAIEENIRYTKGNLKENIQSMKAANDIILNDLDQRIREVEKRINQIPQTEREMIRIQRINKLNEATYNFLKEKHSEASITLASNVPDHRIIDPAHLDPADNFGQVGPRKMLNYAIALFLGLLIPVSFLTLKSFFSNRIVEMEDVSRAVDFPIVGLIPHNPKIKKSITSNTKLSGQIEPSILEAFRSMRSNLMLLAPKTDSKMIVVTSTREQEGKTFTATNLAESFHLLNQKTVYINADLRKPSYTPNSITANKPGLSNYLTGEIDIDELLHHSEHNNKLNIISSGPGHQNAAELFESEAMYNLLNKLKSFRNIIFDTPPVGLVSDAYPLLTKADIVLYVFRHGYSQLTDINFLNTLNQNASPRKVAIVINDVKQAIRYGYGYGYGVGYGKNNYLKPQ